MDIPINYFCVGRFAGAATCLDTSAAICALGTHDGRVIIVRIHFAHMWSHALFDGKPCGGIAVAGGEDTPLVGCIGCGSVALLKVSDEALCMVWKMKLPGAEWNLLACALHPAYHLSAANRTFFLGTSQNLLIMRRMIYKVDVQVVNQHEGSCSHVRWKTFEDTNLLSWANNKGVKVLEVNTMQKVGFLAAPNDAKCTALSWTSTARLVCAWGEILCVVGVMEKVGGLQLLFLQPHCCLRLYAFGHIVGVSMMEYDAEEYLSIATPTGRYICTWEGCVIASDTVEICAAHDTVTVSVCNGELVVCVVRPNTAQEYVESLMEAGNLTEALEFTRAECPNLVADIALRCAAAASSHPEPAIAASLVDPSLCETVVGCLSSVETLRLLAYNTTTETLPRIIARLCGDTFALKYSHHALGSALHILLQWVDEKWSSNLLSIVEERISCENNPRWVLELWSQFLVQHAARLDESLRLLIKLESAPRVLFRILNQKGINLPREAIVDIFRCDARRAAAYLVPKRTDTRTQAVLDILAEHPHYQLTYLQQLAPYRADFECCEERFTELCARYEPHQLRSFVRFLTAKGINMVSHDVLLDVRTTCLERQGQWVAAVNLALQQGLLCEAMEISARAPSDLNLCMLVRNFALREPMLCATFAQAITHLDLFGILPSAFPCSLSEFFRHLPLGFAMPDIHQTAQETLAWMQLRCDVVTSFFAVQSRCLDERSRAVHARRLISGVVVDPRKPRP